MCTFIDSEAGFSEHRDSAEGMMPHQPAFDPWRQIKNEIGSRKKKRQE